MAANDSKRTEQVKLNLTERELLDAARCAALEDRTVAEFIRLTLRTSLYGHVARLSRSGEDTARDE